MVRGVERNPWSDIQRELLEEILQKLTLMDYLKCRGVCQSWRRIVKDVIATKGTCPPAPQLPFLMLLPFVFSIDINKPATLSDIIDTDTVYTMPTQTWKGYFDFDKIFSVQGWLVFQKIFYKENCNHDLILFSNPLSGEEFELPYLPLFPGQDFTHGQNSVKLVFSSAPPDSSDFLVMACATLQLQQPNQKMQQLAFWKLTDKKWTLIQTSRLPSGYPPFYEFIIVDQKLYATSMYSFLSGSVAVFNLRDPNMISFEKLELEPIPMGGPNFEHNSIHAEFCMLARDGDDILLVVHRMGLCLFSESRKFAEIKGFRIFKLDMHSTKWVEVDDLGDRILLMDSAGIQVISAKEIHLPAKFSGGNCIFFYISGSKFSVVFTLKDKRITELPLNHRSLLEPSSSRFLWFMPSPW